jgi:hypothetical protein
MAALAFFQKNPKTKPVIKGILELGPDQKIYLQTSNNRRPYRASLVTPDGHVLLADSEEFLRELARQSKLSQITYEYTEDTDRIEEYRSLLMSV